MSSGLVLDTLAVVKLGSRNTFAGNEKRVSTILSLLLFNMCIVDIGRVCWFEMHDISKLDFN